MSGSNAVAGLSRWVTNPATIGGAVGAGLVALYGYGTLALPPDTRTHFFGLVVLVVVLAILRSDRQEQAALSAVRGLSKGLLSLNAGNLARGVGELFRFPDRSLGITLQNWVGGALLVAGLFRLVPGAGWAHSLRLAALGVAMAPVAALINYLLVLERSRRAIERLAELGLSPVQVIVAAPARRMQLRRRLVIFTAASVLTPMVPAGDLSYLQAERELAEVLGASAPSAAGLSLVPMLVLELLVVGLVLAAAYVSGRALGQPMRRMAGEAQRIASGDLRHGKIIAAEDELWATAAAFTTLQAQLGEAIVLLKDSGGQIAQTSGSLVDTFSRQQAGASEQAASLNETSSTTEELARSARQIASMASQVAQMAEQTLTAAREGRGSAEAFSRSMGRMRQVNQRIADAVVRLNKRVQQIGKIVEFIDGVADKADLLALNAELEGSKAGDVGQGFSLVAAEMRRLAENVLSSTQQISRLIDEIRDSTNAAVMATEAGVKATEAGAEQAQRVAQNLDSILGLAGETSEAVRAISLATQQQQSGTDQLAEAMLDILHTTQASANATRQVAAANGDLANLARELQTVVQRFTVG